MDLVGIYGVKDESANITSFGFITKVNRERQDIIDRVRASQAKVQTTKTPMPTPAAAASQSIVRESHPIAVTKAAA